MYLFILIISSIAACPLIEWGGCIQIQTDIVARVKPKLTDLSKKDARPSLLDDLQQIAILGETFTEQRPRGKVSADIPDKLDREGRRATALLAWSFVSHLRVEIDEQVALIHAQVSICGTYPVLSVRDQSARKIEVCSRHVRPYSASSPVHLTPIPVI